MVLFNHNSKIKSLGEIWCMFGISAAN
jgi:hypothetical protein